MDEKFKQLKEAGHNCVDSLMEWIKESKIIDKTKEAEDRALKLFEETTDRQNVELDKFKEVVKKLAEQEKKSEEQFLQTLVETMPKLQEAMANAAAAFKETMAKK